MKKPPIEANAGDPLPGEALKRASRGGIFCPSDLEAAIKRLAIEFGLQPERVWLAVKRKTEAGKLLIALLGATELLAAKRPRNPGREDAIINAVESLRVWYGEDDFPGKLPPGAWEIAAKELSEQNPPILGNGRTPKPMTPESIRRAYKSARAAAGPRHASRFFDVIEDQWERLRPQRLGRAKSTPYFPALFARSTRLGSPSTTIKQSSEKATCLMPLQITKRRQLRSPASWQLKKQPSTSVYRKRAFGGCCEAGSSRARASAAAL